MHGHDDRLTVLQMDRIQRMEKAYGLSEGE